MEARLSDNRNDTFILLPMTKVTQKQNWTNEGTAKLPIAPF